MAILIQILNLNVFRFLSKEGFIFLAKIKISFNTLITIQKVINIQIVPKTLFRKDLMIFSQTPFLKKTAYSTVVREVLKNMIFGLILGEKVGLFLPFVHFLWLVTFN